MLRIRYELPASNYFLDNGELVFDLRVTIEGLAFSQGIPALGEHSELPNGLHVWTVLDHIVVYRIEGNTLFVRVVMPEK